MSPRSSSRSGQLTLGIVLVFLGIVAPLALDATLGSVQVLGRVAGVLVSLTGAVLIGRVIRSRNTTKR